MKISSNHSSVVVLFLFDRK